MRIIFRILSFLFPDYFQQGPVLEKQSISEKKVSYQKNIYLSESEKNFYKKLKKIENLGNYICIPQINLATIIKKNTKYRSELFRNIDFGVFDNNFNLLLLIELNDKTHNKKSRQARDLKVKELCNKADIKLITFYTKYPNKEEYILHRVLENIKDVEMKEQQEEKSLN